LDAICHIFMKLVLDRARAKGKPAIEASFGYGYTDYVIDKDPNNYDPSYENRGVIDLQHPEGT